MLITSSLITCNWKRALESYDWNLFSSLGDTFPYYSRDSDTSCLADKVSGVLQQKPTTKTSTAARMTIERDTNEHAKNATRLIDEDFPTPFSSHHHAFLLFLSPTNSSTLLIRRVARATNTCTTMRLKWRRDDCWQLYRHSDRVPVEMVVVSMAQGVVYIYTQPLGGMWICARDVPRSW